MLILVPLPSMKPYSTVVEDRNGFMLNAFLAHDGAWRIRTDPRHIPARLKQLVLAKEDRYFYYHPGVNPVSILRAVLQNIRAGERVSGASTITMQVARLLEPKRRTYLNKGVEIFRALQLELRYSKDEILALYLSLVPLGGNIEGLASASLLYYQTPLDRLNTAHLLDLILIPNDPNGLRPDRNPDRLYQARQRLAASMKGRGLLAAADTAGIRHTPAVVVRRSPEGKAVHFAHRVRKFAPTAATVRTTLDNRMQESVARLLANHLRPWKLRGINNGAVVVVENQSMSVRAYVGNVSEADSASGQVDAVQAIRSPGSTLKPFLYAMLFDRGTLTPKVRVLDVPYDVAGYTAQNYDGTFSGWVTAEDALRRSLNVPMVRLLREASIRSFLSFLSMARFQTIEAQGPQLGLSMILGGCGVTLEELVHAYCLFPNEGFLRSLRSVEADSTEPMRSVCSPSSAFMVTEILAGMERPDVPNNFESAMNLPRIAYKTGTSYGRRDAWCIGYTDEYTVGVWIGNVSNKGCADLVGSKSATPLLIDIMNAISSTNRKRISVEPDDIRWRSVCTESGMIPTAHCTHLVRDCYSVTRTIPRFCDVEREYAVSRNGTCSYCTSCLPSTGYRTVTVKTYPPELVAYWRTIGHRVDGAPPHLPSCDRVFAGSGPTVISPSQEASYFSTTGSIVVPFRAASSVDVQHHIWYLNNQFLARIRPGEQLFPRINEGAHVVTCSDEKGRMTTVSFTVRSAF